MSGRKFIGLLAGAALATFAAAPLGAQQSQSSQTPPPKPAQTSSKPAESMPGMGPNMPGMSMDSAADDSAHHAEGGAVHAMMHGHQHMGPHMHMTALRTATPQDWAHADLVASQLREAIERYKDYRVALADGFRIFMPNLPQQEYHFTNYWNGFLESFSFDPSRPTSLLYKKTADGYELIGAMYTMPKNAAEEQLNARIPLGVAQWHQHVNLCMPPRGEGTRADWTRFGLQGSIATEGACTAASGRFYPIIFGWMVHVYPFENSREKIWGQ